MTNEEIGFELKALYKSRAELIAAYKRKKSWEPSVKAMACAAVSRQMEAIRLSYEAVTGKNMIK